MRRLILATFLIGLLAMLGAEQANAAGHRGYYYRRANPANTVNTARVWPYSPNYGNAVGAAYSPAAGMRQGQFFGTFGLRPADARARGAY